MKNVLHMVGNSHIDPVWFWRWEEGMQEVKSTFRSVLDRMNEFPEFKFSCTSASFFAYIKRVDPAMFKEIRARVAQGRWEITGGWWVEPDCNLPCGESFVRQSLYGQRFFQKELGVRARVGSNVDSFGHNPQLPQILRKSGMEGYVFLRPQVTTNEREYVEGRKPVFLWEGIDGTRLPAVSLPGEYTTWFSEPLRKNINQTMSVLAEYPSLPCCFGVGNHGGGPTIQNIRAVQELRSEYPDVELRFSGFGDFFDDLKRENTPLTVTNRYFDHVNAGCYSVDLRFKQAVRHGEQALLAAEKLAVMARLLGCDWMRENTEALWKRLLFNQFHDTLGGTITEEAHRDALADVQGVCVQAETLMHLAMQDIIRTMEIPQKGVPIVLFNLHEKPYCGLADVEIDWFCQNDLRLTDGDGREIAYSRAKQSCSMVWNVLGGRRRILFEAEVPAFSAAVYYAAPEEASLRLPVAYQGDAYTLENERVRFRLNEKGEPVSLVDKRSGFDALKAPCRFSIWRDERDPWGHGSRDYGAEEHAFVTDSVACIEEGGMRKVLRVRSHTDGLRTETLYSLAKGQRDVTMETRLWWDNPWKQLRFSLPVGQCEHVSESPYGVMIHSAPENELFMHRFLDIRTSNGAGLSVVNDGMYGFQPMREQTDLIILRSAIYAQGTSPDWYHDYDVYRYIDLGEQGFTLHLAPHGMPVSHHELFRFADEEAQPLPYLVGGLCGNRGTAALPPTAIDVPNVRLGAAKKAEEGDGIILRLHEVDGVKTQAVLTFANQTFPLTFGAYEIKTLRWDDHRLIETNLLEEEEDQSWNGCNRPR